MNLLTDANFWQNIAIIVTLLLTIYQIRQQTVKTKRSIYLELNNSYLNFLQYCLENPDSELSDFSKEDLKKFGAVGGNRKMLEATNKLVALWEHAFLMKNQIPAMRWQGWDDWMNYYLKQSLKVREGVRICIQMYDSNFQAFILEKLRRFNE